MFANLTRSFLCLFLTSIALPAFAAVAISNTTVPLTPGLNAAAYPHFLADKDDVLLSASSDCCLAVELHGHEIKDGVMRMRRVPTVLLSAGQQAAFGPGGAHVMLIGLTRPLTKGQVINLTFTFSYSPAQTIPFTVVDPSLPDASGSSNQPATHHHH